MSRPSEALRALLSEVEMENGEQPITWAELHRVIEDAAKGQEEAEYADYMGDDL